VHEAAAVGFDRAALAYERGRAEYPGEAVGWMLAATGTTGSSVIVDLAAGTGKLTRLLVGGGARVVAVEPVAGMRGLLADLVPQAEVIDGVAEAIPLPSGSCDLVTVAQAFHWFDGPAALGEIHRVLRPGGWLALAWNRRELDAPIHRSLSAVMEPYRGSTPSHQHSGWQRALDDSPLFEPRGTNSFPNPRDVDGDALVDRVLSVSFVAALADHQRDDVEQAVRALVPADVQRVRLPYTTDVQLYGHRGKPG
jgi:SAM-dependent methyltransferase